MTKFSRREAVKNGTYIVTAGLFLGLTGCFDKKKAAETAPANTTKTDAPKAAEASGSGDPLISEDHPTAKSLKYKHDGASIDPKLRVEKAGVAGTAQNCANCQFYQPVEGKSYGKCQLIPIGGKHVADKGWCLTWAKKA